ncbi:MAG: hypothetical protein Q4C03_07995 [bacterium]|nr:hypothetical protein [bacterium]
MAKSQTWSSSSSSTKTSSTSKTQSQSESKSQSTTSKFLDEALRDQILSGLLGYMTDEEINAYAENLLRPQLNAGIEAAQQAYDTTKLSKEQEIELLADALTRSIEEQENAYRQSMANVETGALARGMGRSSYTLQTLANQGNALAEAVAKLTTDTQKQQSQIQDQITLAAQQNAQTQGRLNTDYASSLAAKVQELKQQQRQEYNQNYLTAVSGSLGQKTEGQETTTGTSTTQSTSTSNTSGSSYSVTKTGGGGGSSSSNKTYNQGSGK